MSLHDCKDCRYFSYRSSVPESDYRPYGYSLDGYCSKVFPRGYIGSGRPGGLRSHRSSSCFQFVPRPLESFDQLSFSD